MHIATYKDSAQKRIAETYKKWKIRWENEKYSLLSRIDDLQKPIDEIWQKYSDKFLLLSKIPYLYSNSDIHGKQAFIKLVFKSTLSYKEGIYRTAFLLPVFGLKAASLKERRLLEIEQPHKILMENPPSAPDGN